MNAQECWEDFAETSTAGDGQKPIEPAVGLFTLVIPEPDSADELIRSRYLTRGSLMQIASETHLGKSVFSMQMGMLFTLGRPFCGMHPTRPLKVLLVQTENDSGELAICREGIVRGLRLKPEDCVAIGERFFVKTPEHAYDWRAVATALLAPLIELHKPDMVILDPLFGFFHGKAVGEELSQFLRAHLQALARQFQIGLVYVHHFAKPPSNKTNHRAGWTAADWSYAGSGGAELANVVRATFSLESTEDKDLVRIRWAKRSQLLDNVPHYLRRSGNPKSPCWFEVYEERDPEAAVVENVFAKLMARIPTGRPIRRRELDGMHRNARVTREQWRNAIEGALETGTLIAENRKHGRTHIAYLRRPTGADAD